MAAPIAVTAHSSVQNLKKSSSRRFDGKSMSLDDRDYIFYTLNIAVAFVGLVIVVVVVSLYFSFFLFNVTS